MDITKIICRVSTAEAGFERLFAVGMHGVEDDESRRNQYEVAPDPVGVCLYVSRQDSDLG